MEGKMGGRLTDEAMDKITARLSLMEGLYFPRSLQQHASVPTQRKILLLDLLSRDAAVFLERYGAELNKEELDEFDPMGDDYEVSWHLRNLRSVMSPSSEELRLRSVRVRNRRLAYLERMVRGGSYFSEGAMREREPYLHHEMVGKFQDPTIRGRPVPGERWSETLLRWCEEAALMEKIRDEQRRLGVPESEIVGNERNLENDDDDEQDEEEEDDEKKSHPEEASKSSGEAQEKKQESDAISEDDMADRMEQFTFAMHQKFLAGEDHQHLDYSQIDHDSTLDDHWHKEANLDAEDLYFAEIDD